MLLVVACSQGQPAHPRAQASGSAGAEGEAAVDSGTAEAAGAGGADGAVVDEAGSSAAGGPGAGAGAGSPAAGSAGVPAAGGGAGMPVAGSTGGAAPAAGSGGMGGVACGGIKPAAHPAFAAIQRLATTQDEVRILVYGQSISEQAWWSKTKDWLQQTYPSGKLVMEEHARGGCSSQCLIGHEAWSIDGKQYNRLPEDVFAWKPDLIIFHVYGDHVDYGYILQAFTQGCAAFENYRTYDGKQVPQVRCSEVQRAMSAGYKAPQVLIQNDFVISDVPVSCPKNPTPSDWDCFMNESVIPEQVNKYGYTLQDNFHGWPTYIAAQHIDPKTLIQSDMTHLTEPAGTDVMFQFTTPHLCYTR